MNCLSAEFASVAFAGRNFKYLHHYHVENSQYTNSTLHITCRHVYVLSPSQIPALNSND
jgi:hypothetical protein